MTIQNGVLVYDFGNEFYLQNIGDYIQSLAANQFMDANIFVNREDLNKYSGRQIKLILNGWFMNHPENFPPSENIIPLFISFHITPSALNKMNSDNTLNYLKKYAPIGCRDMDTLNYLKNKGINAYFSGCLTLTLGRNYSSDSKSEMTYIVEPYVNIRENLHINCIFSLIECFLKNHNKINIINSKINKNYPSKYFKFMFQRYIYCLILYNTYSQVFDDDILLNSEYISHDINCNIYNDEVSKFDYAEKLLNLYSSASLVITSRIHCALPCLGLNTPCIFIQNDESSCNRYNGLTDLFNIVKYISPLKLIVNKQLIKSGDKISRKSVIKNKSTYIHLKDCLINKCEEFVKYK